MSKHPVTPMNESDLRMHLGSQTNREVHLFDIFALESDEDIQSAIFDKLKAKPGIFVLFDTLNDDHLYQTGKILVKTKPAKTQLLIGSSGTEYALTSFLRGSGSLLMTEYSRQAGETDQIVVMSGSAAPTTCEQIEWSISRGFYPIRINCPDAVDPASSEKEQKRIVDESITALNEGKSVVIYTALGPDDQIIADTKTRMQELNVRLGKNKGALAEFQGKSMKNILKKTRLRRVVIAGGDTSGYVSRALGIHALETRIPVAPGAPLCTAHSNNPDFDGLQISLKGGQNGNKRYFESILKGKKLD
jgi:uncharacterized protein YgbK (DUF1537 family)